MREPFRHIEGTVTPVIALLVGAALGFLSLLVLVLMLALGF
jgi:hypothetical protein